MKKVLAFLVVLFSLFMLGACGGTSNEGNENKGNENQNQNQTGETVAKLDSSLQGTYYGDDVTVVVGESKVSITDPTGKTLEFTIYVEGNKYYILEEGTKVYCTFGDGTVTNTHGTFTKKGGSDNPSTDKKANIPANLQGEYYAGPVKVTVYASRVVIEEGSNVMEYTLYEDKDGKIYVIEEGQKIICTFGEDSVTNIFGTFTRDGGMTTVSASEAAKKFAQFLGITATFRIPDGSSVQDGEMTDEESRTYAVTVVNPNVSYDDYSRYFDEFFINQGYTLNSAVYMKIDNVIYAATISFDTKSNTLIVAASIVNETLYEEMAASEFIAFWKEKFGVDLNLPKEVTKIIDKYYMEEYGSSYLSGSFTLDDVTTATQETFDMLAGILDGGFAPAGYEKGELSTQKYSNATEYSIQWLTENYDSIGLSLLVSADEYAFTIGIYATLEGSSTTTNTWPKEDIEKVFGTKVVIPEYKGTFENVYVSNEDGGLKVTLTGVTQTEFDTYVDSLMASGFNENETYVYIKYLDNNEVASVNAYISQYVATFIFEIGDRKTSPWPTDLIIEKFSKDVSNVIPVPDASGATSYNATYYSGSLNISVDAGTQTDLLAKYLKMLKDAGFVETVSYSFEYTFPNYDVVEVSVYSASQAQYKFNLTIEFNQYKGLEYDLPENFVAKINEDGYTLVKIGLSYVYVYQYGTAKMIKAYIYDGNKTLWQYAEGQVYTQAADGASHVMWKNFGEATNPVYYQYVNRPQVDEFLSGTSGLAYMYYENMLDAGENVQKDSSKNATIAGASCEYVVFTTAMGSYYTTKTELWIEPVTKMIYKVDYTLEMSGQIQKNTPFEIKSIDKSVSNFSQAGISNCILPGFDAATATDSDHVYGEEITVPATCGKGGEVYKICSCCGEKKIISSTPATGNHTPVMSGNDAAWFTDYEGHHCHKCTECNQDYDVEDCTFGEWIIDRAPTCKHEGSRHHVCTKCNASVTEKMDADPNAHDYIGYYANNVTIVFPTKEAAGSITWSCREECGHTETLVLPKLEESSYTMAIYEDYMNDKYYKIYGINITKMLSDMTTLLKPAEAIDESYITRTIFGEQEAFVCNYDFNNLVYGFIGEEILDELASISTKYRGELFDDYNNRVVLGENTLVMKVNEEDATYTLYVRDGVTYFTDSEGYKVEIELNDDNSVTVGYYGTYMKRVIATVEEAYRGVYYSDDEENPVKVEVFATYVNITTGSGTEKYVIYIKNDEYYVVVDDEIVYCYFDDESVSNDFGTFYRPSDEPGEDEGEDEGEEGNTEFPTSTVEEFLDVEGIITFYYPDATYQTLEIENNIIVIMTLPEDAEESEVVSELQGSCEDYSEYYADFDLGYALVIEAGEEEHTVHITYFAIE
ncbi:MAG: hypothetical protein J5666_00850 [Bacilli bacterium]|nr:hypothetical protein [Bacilli bacterium]